MKRIGRYRVQGLLGRGGMGRVYKVVHPTIGRIFALKCLQPSKPLEHLIGAERLRALFVEEIRRMASITHPNILTILDADPSARQPHYVMDYHCNSLGQEIGETCRTESPSRPLPVERAVSYTLQILKGLSRLHHAGIVHRDIKPFNILLTAEDKVKICDFGLSRRRGEKFGAPATLKVGSPFYAAPEQEANPDKAVFASDLYAVGVMLYRMLSGRLPKQPAAPISRWHPDLNPDWDDFLWRALAPHPKDRYQNATRMENDLAALHDRWQSDWQNICHGLVEPVALRPERSEGPPQRARALPIKTGPRLDPAHFSLDALWRPRVAKAPRWHKDPGGLSLTDRASGLTWQTGGTPFALDWHSAWDYIDQLNHEGYSGRSDWRLPTIEELITLLQPNPTGHEHCLPPVFESRPLRLWSSDRRAFTSAWYVNLELGFVAWQDFSCHNAIKAVSSASPH